jgi:hypothetical protein
MTVTILKDIQPCEGYSVFYRQSTRIEYDAKRRQDKKQHALIYQQGPQYGSIGDNCYFLTHDELLDLERRGFVRITGRRTAQ